MMQNSSVYCVMAYNVFLLPSDDVYYMDRHCYCVSVKMLLLTSVSAEAVAGIAVAAVL
jgi:hypothetical protein